jgi:hypothetical protein
VERGRKEASSELLSAICDALDVPLSRVLTDAGENMAEREHTAAGVGAPGHPDVGATVAHIDAATKVVIPQVVSMAVA